MNKTIEWVSMIFGYLLGMLEVPLTMIFINLLFW